MAAAASPLRLLAALLALAAVGTALSAAPRSQKQRPAPTRSSFGGVLAEHMRVRRAPQVSRRLRTPAGVKSALAVARVDSTAAGTVYATTGSVKTSRSGLKVCFRLQ